MTSQAEVNLLADLARLVAKHKPSTVRLLLRRLQDPDFMDSIRDLLVVATETSMGAPKKRKVGRPKQTKQRLEVPLSKEELLLDQLGNYLRDQDRFPQVSDLRRFVATVGHPASVGEKRAATVRKVLEQFRGKSAAEIESAITAAQAVTPRPRSGDRSLSAWTRVILDRRDRNLGSESPEPTE